MKDKLTPVGWSIVVTVISFLALSVAGIQYTKYVDDKSSRELKETMCPVLLLSLEGLRQRPITTDIQKRYIEEMTKLVGEFNCKSV